MELEMESEHDSDTTALQIPEDYELKSERQVVIESVNYWTNQFKLKNQYREYPLK